MDYFMVETCKLIDQSNLSKNVSMNPRKWMNMNKYKIEHK
jgi:hypothetical protein